MPSPKTTPPSGVGLNPLKHPWVADATDDEYEKAVIYVRCATERGDEFAHVLFESDWGGSDEAEHIVKLHNKWLKENTND